MISLWVRVCDVMYATIDSLEGFFLKGCTSGDSQCLLANSPGWLNRVSSVMMWVATEYMAPEAAKRCFDRVCNVLSSINFISVARSLLLGSSAVAESFLLNCCRMSLIGLALLINTSTVCRVKTLSRYSAKVVLLEYNVTAN